MKKRLEEELELDRCEIELEEVKVNSKDSWTDMEKDYKIIAAPD